MKEGIGKGRARGKRGDRDSAAAAGSKSSIHAFEREQKWRTGATSPSRSGDEREKPDEKNERKHEINEGQREGKISNKHRTRRACAAGTNSGVPPPKCYKLRRSFSVFYDISWRRVCLNTNTRDGNTIFSLRLFINLHGRC